MQLEKTIDVLMLGYYGFGNLGDELLSKSLTEKLVACGIDNKKIAMLSANPDSSEKLTGVKCFNRWNLGTVSALMKQSKTFLLGGGGLFQDVTSVRSCGYYWWTVRAAKISKTKVWAVSQSVGPLHSWLGKFFARNAFRNCDYIAVRDDKSLEILKKWHINAKYCPDFVMGLQVPRRNTNDGNRLLLNLRPCYDNIAEIAIKQAKYISKRDNIKITGVAFAKEDEVYLENLKANGKIKIDNIIYVKNLDEFADVARSASKAIGMRLHFAELCVLARIPVSMAAYDPKVASFCGKWNLPLLDEKKSDAFGTVGTEQIKSLSEDITSCVKNGLSALL